jgi:preprotein translocase subunit SecB
MAEETNGNAAETGEGDAGAQPAFTISGQYIRDFSFEVPKAPHIFALMQENPPDISINVDVEVEPLEENLYEVVLKVEANCKIDDTAAFILEISYGGLFLLNVEKDQRHYTLLVECPKVLFPFVRHLIANATREGGFPPLLLGLVDFDAMYAGEIQRLQAAQAAADAAGDAPGDAAAKAADSAEDPGKA